MEERGAWWEGVKKGCKRETRRGQHNDDEEENNKRRGTEGLVPNFLIPNSSGQV